MLVTKTKYELRDWISGFDLIGNTSKDDADGAMMILSLTWSLALACIAVSYILTLLIPIPQNRAKASTKFSSLDVKGS